MGRKESNQTKTKQNLAQIIQQEKRYNQFSLILLFWANYQA